VVCIGALVGLGGVLSSSRESWVSVCLTFIRSFCILGDQSIALTHTVSTLFLSFPKPRGYPSRLLPSDSDLEFQSFLILAYSVVSL